MSTSFRAYAKINLGLLVLEKRPDGYHDIETVFHRVCLHDEITLAPSHAITVKSSSSDAPSDERNICFKAAELVQAHLGVIAGVNISIKKNIPVGAGLGGGSSDAASVLLHLPAFWGKPIAEESILSFALQLGSDVPYFLKNGSALATSRGEKLEYFELGVPYGVLLCNPGVHISTAWAYQHVRPKRRSIDLKSLVFAGMRDSQRLREITNDFESGVVSEYPVVGEVKRMMVGNGAVFSLMSGSGSTVYGLYDDVALAQQTSQALAAKGFQTHFTRPLFAPEDPA